MIYNPVLLGTHVAQRPTLVFTKCTFVLQVLLQFGQHQVHSLHPWFASVASE
jgi:hypothetical protein